ncbi:MULTISPECIES: hypothetical protein [Pseudomonas]|jgi:hypothetical protein|uniref:hypothetical protein n=1 Tax=Pseudomonas TaxID=286 RepID=UPI0018E84986|nr:MULTISPECIES: hypothetical protein [Pseudomonas]MBJ2215780.1 hypothetical protein [Pseudomonas carnis]MBP5948045.1 hypothetical protein [Pseudomonas sp. P9(2020)]
MKSNRIENLTPLAVLLSTRSQAIEAEIARNKVSDPTQYIILLVPALVVGGSAFCVYAALDSVFGIPAALRVIAGAATAFFGWKLARKIVTETIPADRIANVANVLKNHLSAEQIGVIARLAQDVTASPSRAKLSTRFSTGTDDLHLAAGIFASNPESWRRVVRHVYSMHADMAAKTVAARANGENIE